MVPIDHARLHVRDFGGCIEDYVEIDEFLDSTKCHCPDYRHRAILHSSFGMELAERIFGRVVTNSVGCEIPVRELVRRHIMQDCDCVPTVKEWLDALSEGTARRFNHPQKKELKWLKENNYTPNTEVAV